MDYIAQVIPEEEGADHIQDFSCKCNPDKKTGEDGQEYVYHRKKNGKTYLDEQAMN